VDPDREYPEGVLDLRPELVVVEPEDEYAEGLSDLSPEPVFPEPADEMSEPEPEEPSPPPWRQIMATLTAYSFESCWSPACLTRSGTPARWGVVATDPRVIPLGSRLLIEQYPEMVFIAEDTGSGVLGNHVDIWQPSTAAAVQFGLQRGMVTVLE
jgi:3D (Asp-Asp-Asp) domain-containing protein